MKVVSKKDIIQWDIENWSQALQFWEGALEQHADKNNPILTLGERYGGLSLWLASNGYANYCTDYVIPESEAKSLHQQYGVESLVTYKDVNIYEIPFPDQTFDVVIVKSVIGGLKLDHKNKNTRTLENQKKAVEEIRRVLKPGGIYLGVENMKGSAFHTWLRRKTKKDQGWRYLSHDELDFLLDGFSERNYKFYGFLGTIFPSSFINTITGFFDKILSAVLPKSSLYIGMFIAKK